MDNRVQFGAIPGNDKEEPEKQAVAPSAPSATTAPTAAAAPQEDPNTKMRKTV